MRRELRWTVLLLVPLLLGVVLKRFPENIYGSALDVWPDGSTVAGPDEELAPNFNQANVLWVENNLATCPGARNCLTWPCWIRLDEIPSAPDGEVVAPLVADAAIFFEFPTPAFSPSSDTDAQSFEVTMSKCDDCDEDGAGDDPTYDMALLCSGVFKELIALAIPITGLDQNTTYSFTLHPDCAADGSDVQVNIVHHRSGGTVRDACIEAIEWEVSY